MDIVHSIIYVHESQFSMLEYCGLVATEHGLHLNPNTSIRVCIFDGSPLAFERMVAGDIDGSPFETLVNIKHRYIWAFDLWW